MWFIGRFRRAAAKEIGLLLLLKNSTQRGVKSWRGQVLKEMRLTEEELI
jgi:hypothetical protein